MASNKHYKIRERQLQLRQKLWPELDTKKLWNRTERDGFISTPRTMPLILSMLDDMSKGKPVSSVYFELWCRSFDEGFVTLSKHREMAFHSGLTGQRAERTWALKMKILNELKFIDIKPGSSGPLSYALIWNPYMVIKDHHENGHSAIREDKYNALIARALEIGANDLDDIEVEEEDDETPF